MADILGTKRLVEIIQQATNAVIPQAAEDLEKLGQLLDEEGLVVTDLRRLMGAATETFEKAEDAIPTLLHLVAALVDHLVRVGTQASLAAQDARKTSTEVRTLLAAIRAKGLKVIVGQ